MMTKREVLIYGLGKVSEMEKHETVKLDNLFGDKSYEGYELGKQLGNVTIFDVKSPKVEDMRHKVVTVTEDFNVEQIVNIMLQALAFDIKNRKGK